MGNCGEIWDTVNIHTPNYVPYISLQQSILLPVNVCKIDGRMTNSEDPVQTPRSGAYDLGLHCLLSRS